MAIRDAFLPLNLYLEYAYPVNDTIINVSTAVVTAIIMVFFTHVKYKVSLKRYSKCLKENQIYH